MYSYKDIWKVSLPIMLGLVAQSVVQFTDTYFLKSISTEAQSASGLAGIYYIAFFTLCFGFSIGAQILIGRRNGEGSHNKIGTIVIQGIIFLEILAAILICLSLYMSNKLLPQLMESEQVAGEMSTYISWRIFGLIFSSFNVMFRAFYVGIARTKVLTINAVIMALVNVVLDYVLIFGHFGFPMLGVAGAAIATVIAEFVSVLFFAIYSYKTVDLKKYGFMRMKFRFSIIRNILKISSFTMIQYLVSMTTWFFFFVAMEKHSVDALAITNIVRNFYILFFIPMNAFATTANTLVSNTMGKGNVYDVIPLIKRIVLMGIGAIVVVMIITLSMPEFWISLIAPDDNLSLIPLAVEPLAVVVFGLPICCMGTIVFSSVSGTGRTSVALAIEFIALIVYVLYMLWIVVYKQSSVAMCWTVEYVYWGGLLILSVLYFRYANWRKKRL